jgi:HEAT repeat protein
MGLFGFKKGKERPDDGTLARVRELASQLDDPDPKVRLAACRELGRLGRAAAPASEKLQERLDDDDGDVCNAAAAALSEIER